MSSLAYQAEDAERDWVASLARALRPPDLTLLLDVPVEVAAARRRAAGRVVENDDDELLRRVAEKYRRLAGAYSTAAIIDASGSIDEVAEAVASEVRALLAARSARAIVMKKLAK